jgi:hypothetical protein
MQPKKDETPQARTGRGLCKPLNRRQHVSNSRAKPAQREYPEGWSRWVEPEAPCYADDFLEDWGDAIVQLRASNHYELNREASAWQRAMQAYAHWRAA